MSPRYQNRIELLQGTLDLLILQTLRRGPQHGYALSLAIRANSGDGALLVVKKRDAHRLTSDHF